MGYAIPIRCTRLQDFEEPIGSRHPNENVQTYDVGRRGKWIVTYPNEHNRCEWQREEVPGKMRPATTKYTNRCVVC